MQNQLEILIVSVDPLERRAAELAVHKHQRDACVHEASTCEAATEAILTRHFDCVLLDNDLPDGTGMKCVMDAREAGITTPIIILAGHGNEKLALEAIRIGATDYLPKDEMTPHLLLHCLRGALRYHQAQDQVRQATDALKLRDRAIAAASNGIVICDPNLDDCPIIYINPAFTLITGYSHDEAVGRNCRFLQGGDSDRGAISDMRHSLNKAQDCHVTLKNYRKDGTPFWNDLTISPVRDTSGELTHFIGVQTDITERRDAEEALRVNISRQQAFLRDMFSSVTEGKLTLCATRAELPDPFEPFGEVISLSRKSGLRELRHQTLSACVAVGQPDDQRYDMETAVGEAGMNAVVHAGTGKGRIFINDKGTVQVRVEDAGTGIAVENLPNATLRRGYSSAGTMGHGFKMILMTVNRVYLMTGLTGTTVVLEQDRHKPEPVWS